MLLFNLRSSTLANVENTPVKKLLSTEKPRDSSEAIEETPIKDDTDLSTSDMMAREIQRLSLRLRSSNPRTNIEHKPFIQSIIDFILVYNVPVVDNQSSKPTALHLSQVVNRVSRCNYVLRRFVREAQKYHSQTDEIRSASQPVVSLSQSSDSNCVHLSFQRNKCLISEGRRRLFIDSPKTKPLDPQLTPRKASGVIKQLFASPSASLKRSLPSPNHSSTTNDKRRRLF